MPTPRTAILLAAGCARRLGELTANRPKCLLEVGGKSLIEHQISALNSHGIKDVIVVTGYFAGMVEEVCASIARFVRNPVFDTTNSLYSLSLALPEARDGFILTNADVLFHPELLGRLVRSHHPDALLYEPNSALGEEEMKVRHTPEGRVLAMAKDLPLGTYQGENLGVVKFSADGVTRLAREVERLVGSGDVNAWAPKAFDAMCADHPIHAVSAAGLPWIEIDFPDDLERARTRTWPAIESRSATIKSMAGEGGAR